MKKVHSFLILGVLLLGSCGAGNSSSQSSSSESSVHVHTFSEEWDYDETYHWHSATCEHKEEISDKAEHKFCSWIIDEYPTEEKEGSRHRWCITCMYRVDEAISKTDHTHYWEAPIYAWSSDNTTCTAKRTCSKNRSHFEEETVSSSYSVVIEPTEDSTGVGRYVAAFENPAFQTQEKDVPIAKLDHTHNWETPTYSWSLDNTTCTAKRTCLKNRYHVEEEAAASSYSVVIEPTEDSTGVGRYVAVFENPAFQTQEKDVIIPKKDIPVRGVSLTRSSLELSIGDYYQLIPVIEPYNATNQFVEWSTSNIAIATVSDSGLVTAVNDGNAVITATTVDGSFTASCEIIVTHIAVTGVALDTATITLEEGETGRTIYANVSPSTATISDVRWSIDNPDIATIETTYTGGCKLTALQAGFALVTATTIDGGYTAVCKVTVVEKKNFSYEIEDSVVTIYEYRTSYSSQKRVNVYFPVTNKGNVNIYIGACSIDIQDGEGNLKQTFPYPDCDLQIVRPGETTYVHDDAQFTGDTDEGLVGIPHFTIKDASSADGTRYEISNIQFIDNSPFGFKANGTITNNNDAASNLIEVGILLFDVNDKFVTGLSASISDDLAPGETVDFSASNYNLLYRDKEFTKNDIGRYEAYAWEFDTVY